jgi:hypothetical protein
MADTAAAFRWLSDVLPTEATNCIYMAAWLCTGVCAAGLISQLHPTQVFFKMPFKKVMGQIGMTHQ